jgi:hypothetical protein
MRALLFAAASAFAVASAAPAEIFKCVGPNGDVRFTSNAAQCPNTAPHAPKDGALQRVEKAEAPLTSARPGALTNVRRSAAPAARDAAAASASESAWRNKRAEAERNLRTLEAAHEQVMAAVRWCNKGHGVTTENTRTGIRQQVPCGDIDADRVKIESELASARGYLATGLEEECRQAGCLPGWIR